MSIVKDTFLTYRAPRKTIKSIITSSGESQALLFLILGSILHFFGSIPFLIKSSGDVALTVFLSANFIGVVILAPLIFYFFAVLGKLGTVVIGWKISWMHSRIALFWALYAVFPLTMVRGLLSYAPKTYDETLQVVLSFTIFAIFLFYWFVGMNEANKLKVGA